MKKLYKQNGVNAIDRAFIRASIEKEMEVVQKEATDKAFFFMLSIPLNVLANDYWSKSAKKRMPKFIEEVISLYESVERGLTTYEELEELLDDLAGVDVRAEWLKRKEKNDVL